MTRVHLWGTNSAVCAVVNGAGKSLPFCVDGIYADSMQEQFSCEDNCFVNLTLVEMTQNGWLYETVENADGEAVFLILSCGETKLLLADRPDIISSETLRSRGEAYQFVFLRAGKNDDLSFLLHAKCADTVFCCDAYGAVPQTKEKLSLLGYTVHDITDTAGVTLVLSEHGGCRVEFQ